MFVTDEAQSTDVNKHDLDSMVAIETPNNRAGEYLLAMFCV